MAVKQLETITRLDAGAGERLRLGHDHVTILVSGSTTENQQLVIEVATPPGGGPPLHEHRAEEVFLILEGQFEFPTILDGQRHAVMGCQGDIVFIPGGVPHTFRNIGPGIGRLLGVLAPAADIEGFYRHVGDVLTEPWSEPSLDDPIDVEKVLEAAHRYNVQFLEG